LRKLADSETCPIRQCIRIYEAARGGHLGTQAQQNDFPKVLIRSSEQRQCATTCRLELYAKEGKIPSSGGAELGTAERFEPRFGLNSIPDRFSGN